MNDWNPDDLQGRRRDQVEHSMSVFGYCTLGLLPSFVAVLLMEGAKFLL